MDKFRIDGHKLMYHVSRVNQWLQGKTIYPIYMEISPSGSCNQRCSFCALDYLGYKPRFLDADVLKKFLNQVSKAGVKSLMYAGEGEPLLHKDLGEIIVYTKKQGLDVSVTTNAVFCNSRFIEGCLESLSWLRVSLNAGSRSSYAKIHRTSPDDFNLVLENLQKAVSLKKQKGYGCTIGVQTLLLSDNVNQIKTLAGILKNIGVDYFSIKPFSPHPKSCSAKSREFKIEDYLSLFDRLEGLADSDFNIIFRSRTMQKLNRKKPYKRCLGLPFFGYVTSGGDIYSCSTFLGDSRFCYGNIYKESFSDIWNGNRRKDAIRFVESELDISDCRQACRLDEINSYLWELKNPPQHVNFI
jgi:GTP 3',8-cyclase